MYRDLSFSSQLDPSDEVSYRPPTNTSTEWDGGLCFRQNTNLDQHQGWIQDFLKGGSKSVVDLEGWG